MIINIIYKSDHCIADILYRLNHLLIFFGARRCSLDGPLSVCCYGELCLCIICRISGFDVRFSSRVLISIIILLLFVSCAFILSAVRGIISRILSFCCGCCMIF